MLPSQGWSIKPTKGQLASILHSLDKVISTFIEGQTTRSIKLQWCFLVDSCHQYQTLTTIDAPKAWDLSSSQSDFPSLEAPKNVVDFFYLDQTLTTTND